MRIAISSKHRLATIAEARSLHGRDLEAAAQLVDDERRESFAFNVLGDDDERLAGLHHGFENRQHRLQRRQLLLVDQDVGVSSSATIFSALVMKYGER